MTRVAATPIKDKVVEAALELFAARGIAAVSVRDIALRSGASEGALYRHWGSKEAMAQALFRDGFTALAAEMRRIMQRWTGFEARLSAIVTFFCRRFDEIQPLMTFMLLRHHDELVTALRPTDDTPVLVLEDLIRDAVARAELPPILPSLGAALALGLMVQPATFMIYGRRIEGPLLHLAPTLAQSACAALRVAATRSPQPAHHDITDLIAR